MSYSVKISSDLLYCDLEAVEKMTLIALKLFADSNNECFPSVSKLSEVVGASKSTVQRKLKSLEEKGYIEIVKRKNAYNGNTSNLYILHEVISSAASEQKESLDHAPTKAQSQDLYSSYKSTSSNSTKFRTKSQEQYSMKFLEKHFDYLELIEKNPEDKTYIDSIISYIHDELNKPKNDKKEKLLSLDGSDILYVIHKYKEAAYKREIKAPKRYVIKLLYEAKNQRIFDIRPQSVNPYKTKFHNFKERDSDYDYDALIEEFGGVF
ncbi:hypothetical protein P261_00514 [Lachnospiraceae bacterium TWA4]|nr:hypothetical protein P261_00514 [Lachnospiraceae bacterium TWA4]